MCGICGIANSDPDDLVDRATLERMRDVMSYRGPDDAGLHIDGAVGLGHRRLSIIDLAAGHQPMANEDGSSWIVFNGEIYNYLELRRAYLEGRHEFATASDTEVILHLYEEFGEDCVRHLNGMFAFAIWDAPRRRLFLARDRLGVKPLYYAARDGSFVFASEAKALLQHDKVSVEVDPGAIHEFMTFGYVHTPRTLFAGIEKLPEGHTLTWQDGRVSVRRYWDLDFVPDGGPRGREWSERLLALLDDSIRLRLRSDVPVGVFLSGGVDSSAVVALLARSVGRIKTFSIGFDAGPAYNELAVARRVAERFGTDHHEMTLDPRDFRDFIPRFVYHMDEPVTEAAAIPLYFVSEMAARHVKVVLSGEGADELFAGYPIYRYMQLIEGYRRLPSALRASLVAPLLRSLRLSPKVGKYAHLATLPLEERYLNVHLHDTRVRDSLYRDEFRRSAVEGRMDPTRGAYRRSASWDVLSRMLYLDTKNWLPNDILIKADRMSMAASIELREPFLDYRLAEFAATIPSRYKLRGGRTKHILKQAVSGVLPREILRRKKMGFPTPLARMFQGELKGYVEQVLLDRRTEQRGYFEPATVRRLVREHLRGEADHHGALWRLLILEEWHRRFVDAAPAAPPQYEPRVTSPAASPVGLL